MKRIVSLMLLSVFLAVGTSACSLFYSSVEETDGNTVSEVGLIGFPKAGPGETHGLLPLWRHTEPE